MSRRVGPRMFFRKKIARGLARTAKSPVVSPSSDWMGMPKTMIKRREIACSFDIRVPLSRLCNPYTSSTSPRPIERTVPVTITIVPHTLSYCFSSS